MERGLPTGPYQQARRWQQAGVFEQIAHELRLLERVLKDRPEQPTAAVLDGRVLRSTPESGHRASYEGYKRTNGSKVHIAVDTLGNLLAVVISGAKTQERHQVAHVCAELKEATGGTVELAYVDQGYTGKDAKQAAEAFDVELEVVKHAEAKKGRGRGSCCCHVGGWSSEPLAGWHAIVGWPATTSDSRRRSPPTTGSPSSVSCSPASNSLQVHNTL